jgi:AcrR family transcriptional regulator
MANLDNPKPPRGKAAVTAALIASATTLYSEKGPTGSSIRDIAKHARVNHGLVHRHFGSREALMIAVMEGLAFQVNAALGPIQKGETLHDLLPLLLQDQGTIGTHWRILAHSILAGEDPATLQQDFPVFHRLVAAAKVSLGPEVNGESVATYLVSTGLGLMLFNSFFQAAAGQDDPAWKQTRKGVLALVLKGLAKAP